MSSPVIATLCSPSNSANWRPPRFSKHLHPLFLIVSVSVFLLHCLLNMTALLYLNYQKKHGRTRLMEHPLVTHLLNHKWKTYGQYIFFGNLFIYIVFLTFLTSFGLVVLKPVERICEHMHTNLCVAMQTYAQFVPLIYS